MAEPSAQASKLARLPLDPKDRSRFTQPQLGKYMLRIKLPDKYFDNPVLLKPEMAHTKEYGLPLLRALHLYHLVNVRFENLSLHYSPKKTISLNMDDLYAQIVDTYPETNRGGRCMEMNGFFGTVLRSLGYEVRNIAGRVSRMMSPNAVTREEQGQTYDGWNHMLNLVRIEGHWWVVDVGMGAMGPNIIYPLEDGFETVAIPPRKIRLQKRGIPENAARDEKDAAQLWCYDVCYHPQEDEKENEWIPTYCFTETEFLPQDYEMMSWYTSTHPRSFFTYSVMCTKMFLEQHGEEKIVGDLTLFNDSVRKTVAGKRTEVKALKTERDRLSMLDILFGIRFTDEDKNSVRPEVKLEGDGS